MARFLKQSTAFIFRIGPFLDSTDGFTAETGLTISQADIQISKDGGAYAQTSASSPTTTHDTDGWYQCPLTTTDTNTLGPLSVQIVETGALPVWEHFMVLPANIYDSWVDGSDLQDINLAQWLGVAPDALSSGKVASDLKLWLASAPSALSSGNVAADLKLWLAGAPSSLIAGRVDGSMGAIDGDATAADRLVRSINVTGLFTVNTTSFTPVNDTSDPDPLLHDTTFEVDWTNDPGTIDTNGLKGRIIIFERGTTTTGNRVQGAQIKETITGAGGDLKLTVTLLTSLPVSGDTMVLL